MVSLNLPTWARELVERARVARLGLIDDDGRPRVLPVTFVIVEEAVWSAVDDKPKRRPGRELARVRFLRARPMATLCVDHYDDDWQALAWVQLLGRVSVLDEAAPHVLERLADKYGPYRQRAPGGPFLRLDAERALCWRARE